MSDLHFYENLVCRDFCRQLLGLKKNKAFLHYRVHVYLHLRHNCIDLYRHSGLNIGFLCRNVDQNRFHLLTVVLITATMVSICSQGVDITGARLLLEVCMSRGRVPTPG